MTVTITRPDGTVETVAEDERELLTERELLLRILATLEQIEANTRPRVLP